MIKLHLVENRLLACNKVVVGAVESLQWQCQ